MQLDFFQHQRIVASPALFDLAAQDSLLPSECQEAVDEFCRCNRLVGLEITQAVASALVGNRLFVQPITRFSRLFELLYHYLSQCYPEQFPIRFAALHWNRFLLNCNESRACWQQQSKQHCPTRLVGDLSAIAHLPRQITWQQSYNGAVITARLLPI
jgi:hypothetical protein